MPRKQRSVSESKTVVVDGWYLQLGNKLLHELVTVRIFHEVAVVAFHIYLGGLSVKSREVLRVEIFGAFCVLGTREEGDGHFGDVF